MEESARSIKKFTFDTEFKGKKVFISDEARQRQRFSLTKSEMDQLKEDGRVEGQQSVEAKAAEHTAQAVEKLADELRDRLDAYNDKVDDIREEAYHFSLAVAKKLAGALLDACPAESVEEILREAARQAVREPKITLRASPGVIEVISARAADIAQEQGFDGRLELVADRAMKGVDCRVEWVGGGVEQSMQVLETAISEIITRHFSNSVKDTD